MESPAAVYDGAVFVGAPDLLSFDTSTGSLWWSDGRLVAFSLP